jgi:hypothetical protein
MATRIHCSGNNIATPALCQCCLLLRPGHQATERGLKRLTLTGPSPEFGIIFMIMARQFYGLASLSSFSSNPIEVSGLEPWKRLQKLA